MDQQIIYNLQQEIDAAHSIEQLRGIGALMPDMVRLAVNLGEETTKVVQLISRLNDAVTLRLIDILQSREGIRLPEGATFLVLGSEGRGEQTLRTDQDNAIVYSDVLLPEDLVTIKLFATRLVDALEEIGVPRCPGNVMACNPQWCRSASEWKILVKRWITVPTPEHVLNLGMFLDLRALHGDETPAMNLRDHICAAVKGHGLFFHSMACHVVRFPSPFTVLGNIRVEERGKHRGLVDLKKAGIFAITTGTSLLALENGIIGGDTWGKLELLGKLGLFSAGDLEVVVKSFTFLVQLRLEQQLQELAAGTKTTHYVDSRLMTDNEQEQFREVLKGVNTYLGIFHAHYLLDFVSA